MIFQFDNYKEFARERIAQMPKKGRGELQRLAEVLRMHPTTVSHVFKGDKDLTLEQAASLCGAWGLNANESEYLVSLVELQRAGSVELKKILRKRLQNLKEESLQLKSRIPKDLVMNEMDQALFYSEWYYSAIRMLCDLPEVKSIDQIAEHLGLPVKIVNEVLQFLKRTRLVLEEKGKFKLGPSRTFIGADSILVHRHHANWRIKAIERHAHMSQEKEFAFTSPMTISVSDSKKVREILLKAIEKILEINKSSPSEELRVLNIDWLRV